MVTIVWSLSDTSQSGCIADDEPYTGKPDPGDLKEQRGFRSLSFSGPRVWNESLYHCQLGSYSETLLLFQKQSQKWLLLTFLATQKWLLFTTFLAGKLYVGYLNIYEARHTLTTGLQNCLWSWHCKLREFTVTAFHCEKIKNKKIKIRIGSKNSQGT